MSARKTSGVPRLVVSMSNQHRMLRRALKQMPAFFSKLYSDLRQMSVLLGGVLLVLFVFLVVSGTILSFFYDPSPETTYQSMATIAASPWVGFIRNFHFWSSDVFLFVLFLHITRVALTKPSGRPRMYAWWVGIGLLMLVGAEMLIGTFMRGDQEALEAYSHFFIGTTGIVANYVPYVTIMTDFFSEHSALFRFFITHAILIPFSIMSLMVLHGLFAPTFRAMLAPWKKVSDAAIRGSLRPEGFTKFPSVRKLALMSLVAFGVITILSYAVPAPLLSSPYVGVEVTKPPWWLLWIVAIENVWGLAPIVIMPPILFLIFAIIPFFSKDKPGPDLGVYIYVSTVAALIALSFWAAFAEQVAHTEHFIEQQQAASVSGTSVMRGTAGEIQEIHDKSMPVMDMNDKNMNEMEMHDMNQH